MGVHVVLDVPLGTNLEPSAEFRDLRFRALMSETEWASLRLAIRRRFSKRPADGRTAVYAGEVLETFMSRAGWSGVALPRHHLRHPRRAARRPLQLHAASHPSALRPAHPPDGHVPGD